MIRFENNFIYLQSKSLTLVFEVKQFYFDNCEYQDPHNRRYIIQRYFGPTSELPECFEPSKKVTPPQGSCRDYNTDYLISSSFGDGNNSEPAVIIYNSDNSFTNRFFFHSARKVEKEIKIKGPHTRNISETLEIVELDDVANIEIHHYYSVCEDSDVFVSKKVLVNNGDLPINLRRLASLEMPIEHPNVKIHSYDGAWLCERERREVYLKSGAYVNQSFGGSSSHKHNPYIEVTDLENGKIYGFNLIYSGNHKEIIDIDPIEHGKFISGINDFGFDFLLNKGDSFMTPEAVFTVAKDLDTVTHEMHNFVNNHIIHPRWNKKTRPILFNSWEGSVFDINETNLLEMADVCAKIGIELFVIDDGWFKGRNNSLSSLGDWVADEKKFPNGIGDISKKIKAKGLQFGIWVEPEMISMNSDLYRAHPEYALRSDKRYPLERRTQLMIDMANPEVVDYLYGCLSRLIEEARPNYIKWDFNRFIIDLYSSTGIRCGEYFHNFVMGLYDLLERLTINYPEVLFEGCSSGGGRYDLGIFYYMPQTWGSDNSSSYCRLSIGTGTFAGYPISTFGAHVSRDHNDFGRLSSLEDRFNLNCFGGFGYEFDVRKASEHEVEIMQAQCEFYKEHKALIQFGNYYSVANYFDDRRYSSFMVVSNDKSEAILFAAEVEKDAPNRNWVLKNLNPTSTYEIKVRHQDNQADLESFTLTGERLMTTGLDLGDLSNTTDSDVFKGFYSRLVYIKEVK